MGDDDMEDYGFEYSDEEPEEEDVDIENQYYNAKGERMAMRVRLEVLMTTRRFFFSAPSCAFLTCIHLDTNLTSSRAHAFRAQV